MRKIKKDYGYLLKEKNYVVGFIGGNTSDGFPYKDIKAFYSGEGICYVAEKALGELKKELNQCKRADYDTEEQWLEEKQRLCQTFGWTRNDFLKLCGGAGFEKLAEDVFLSLTWQSPTQYFDEMQLTEQELPRYGLTKEQVNEAWGYEYFPNKPNTNVKMKTKIYIILKDICKECNQTISIVLVTTDLVKATETFNKEVESVYAHAKKCGYLTDASGDDAIDSWKDGYAQENHYNVRLESFEMEDEETRPASVIIKDAIAGLEHISNNGYIPYASPAPSTSEKVIKRELDDAKAHLENALFMHQQTYGKQSRQPEDITVRISPLTSTKKKANPGTVIHGTLRSIDLIQAFMGVIFRLDVPKYREILKKEPRMHEALCDLNAGIKNDWWETEEATMVCDELTETLGDYAPEGHYFGTHPGDGSDFGFWPDELEG